MLELGTGFAFVGRQFPIKVDEQEYFIDLLFYHTQLRRYIVVELKAGKFKAEYVGKLNMYLTAVNEALNTQADDTAIGLILCRDKDRALAKYSLDGLTKPRSIANYSNLPSKEALENHLLDESEDKENIYK